MLGSLEQNQRIKFALFTAGANGFAALIKLVVSIVSISLLVRYLGVEKYGVIATIMSMVVWLSTIADGGSGLSLKNELVAEEAKSNMGVRKRELISSAFFAIILMMIFIGTIVTVLIEVLPLNLILNLQVNIPYKELKDLILLSAWLIILITMFSLPRSIYSSAQKEYLFAPWSILGSLMGLLMLWLFILNNFSLITVGAALLLGNVTAMLLATLWFQIKMRDLSFSFKKIKWPIIKQLLRPSAAFFVLQISAVFIFQVGIFIVNFSLGQIAAAVYSIHFQIFMYFQILASLIIGPFWSAFGNAFHKNDYNWFRKTIFVLIIGLSILFSFYAMIINVWGKEIIAFWTHNKIVWDPVLGFCMSIYFMILIVISIIMTALNSVNIIGSQVKMVVVQAILNVVLSTFLVHLVGMRGVVLGAILSYLLTVVWYMPIKLKRFLKTWKKDQALLVEY